MPKKTNVTFNRPYSQYTAKEKEQELILIAIIMGDCVCNKLYELEGTKVGYIAVLCTIREWANEFYKKNKHTIWEDNEDCWDDEANKFAMLKLKEHENH